MSFENHFTRQFRMMLTLEMNISESDGISPDHFEMLPGAERPECSAADLYQAGELLVGEVKLKVVRHHRSLIFCQMV